MHRDRLPAAFVWSARIAAAGAAVQPFRFSLHGQTQVLELNALSSEFQLARRTGTTATDPGSVMRAAHVLAPGDCIRIVKSADLVGVYVNDERLLLTPCAVEDWRAGSWEEPGPASSLTEFAFQKLQPVVFADDFMHEEAALGEWQVGTGTWKLHALDNPIRSANAFSLYGKGPNASILAGHWFWRNYTFSCAVQPLGQQPFGLVFYWTAPENHYRIRCQPARDGDAGALIQLERTVHGQTSLLGETALVWPATRWAQLEVSVLEGLISLSLDERLLLQAEDKTPLLGGRIGAWTADEAGIVFDDAAVTPTAAFAWRAAENAPTPPLVLRRSAQLLEGAQAAAADVIATDSGRALQLGGLVRANVSVEAEFDRPIPTGTTLQLRARQLRADTHLALECTSTSEGARLRLLAVDAGRESELGAATTNDIDTRKLNVHIRGDEIWGGTPGRLLCAGRIANNRTAGNCGLQIDGVPSDLRVRAFAVRPAEPLPSIENRIATFEHERSMQSWSAPACEWLAEATPAGTTVYWHRSDFWQDLEMAFVQTAMAGHDLGPAWGLALWGGGDTARELGPSLRLTVQERNEASELVFDGLHAEPLRTDLRDPVERLELIRRQDRLLIRLNGETVWNEPLPDSFRGLCRVGRFGAGDDNAWAQAVRIRAGGVQTYAFKRAPADWIPLSGDWKVTNRWQCDPRWSFFAGHRRNGVASIWNKRQHGPNVTIEFFAGPKMDQARGGKYEYAADINAVICGDGHDITSGYSFMFGGWNDRGSFIVNGDTVLAENTRIVVPRTGATHRRWFHVKIRKQGELLSFWVDGVEVANVQHTPARTGNRFGLWTQNNGVMVAQLRVATDGALEAAAPSHAQGREPRTPYSKSE